jgi:hypothetical protein
VTARTRPADGERRPVRPRGTVGVRVQGRPEDVNAYVARLVALGALHSPAFAYRDRNGVTIRRYLSATIDKETGS